MKSVRNSLTVFAASVVMAGTAHGQDKSALFHQGLVTNSIAGITLEMKTEPKFVLGSSTRLTGLFVDLITPQQTWNMLNPSVPVRNLQASAPPYLMPVKAPRPIHDSAVNNEPDFAVLRLSFP